MISVQLFFISGAIECCGVGFDRLSGFTFHCHGYLALDARGCPQQAAQLLDNRLAHYILDILVVHLDRAARSWRPASG